MKITPKEAERFLRSDIVKEHLMKSTAEVEERIQAMTPYLLDSAVYLLKTTKSDKVKLALINSLLEKAGIGDRKQAGVQININATIADRARSILAENLKNGTVIDINSQLGESPEEKQS